MTHGHHEYLFDYRYKDLETGKLNIDKLTTLNSNTSLYDMIEPGREPSYEYCMMIERQREEIAQRSIHKKEREERELREAQEQVRLRLVKREEEEAQAHEKVVTQYSIFGGQRIITSKWKTA